jgi:hypothetical protein
LIDLIPGAYERLCALKAKAGKKPGVSLDAMYGFARLIRWVEEHDGVGYARRTARQFAGLSRAFASSVFGGASSCCERHIRRLQGAFALTGLVAILNTMIRHGADLWRAANVIVPSVDIVPAPLPADVDAPDPVQPESLSGVHGVAARLAALFGLRVHGRWLWRPRGDAPVYAAGEHPAPA